MEINQNPLGQIENIVIRDPEHLTIKYIPVQNGINEMAIESKVVGTATRKEMIEREIIFDAPKNDAVLKVVNVMEDIEVKDATVTNSTILVNGFVNTSIMYTTMKRPQSSNNNQNNNNQSANGYVSMGNSKNSDNNNNNKNKNKEKERPRPSCDVVDYSIAVDGVVRHTTVRIPFRAFLPAEDYQEGDFCSVTSSSVSKDLGVAAVTPIYEEMYDEAGNIITTQDDSEPKFIKGIINKTLIELAVDIKRYSKE